ncbi:MAG: hypothetical protein MO846_10150 [Candidatus Devosia symbiotica]|nr:hypothetical protein [Candidatus Devosia symbiotica]
MDVEDALHYRFGDDAQFASLSARIVLSGHCPHERHIGQGDAYARVGQRRHSTERACQFDDVGAVIERG